MSANNRVLVIKFGGHAMAAGLTIAPDRLSALAEFLDERLGAAVTAAQAGQSLALDLAVAPGGLVPPLVETLESAGPYGMGWPGPRVAVGPVRLVKAHGALYHDLSRVPGLLGAFLAGVCEGLGLLPGCEVVGVGLGLLDVALGFGLGVLGWDVIACCTRVRILS